MKPYSTGRAVRLHGENNWAPMLNNNTYTVREHEDLMDDEDAVPGNFERHPLGWTVSYPQASRRPLIDYCTNEWKEKLDQGNYRDRLDWEFEDDEDEWLDYYLNFLRSRKTRRWALFITLLTIFFFYLYSTIQPRVAQDRMLTESLRLREQLAAGRLFGGVFGNNVRPLFPDMLHMKTLDPRYLPGNLSSQDSGRLVFVGDIHGCKEELQALLEKVRFDSKKDHLITTGDMIAKGPDSLGTVDLLRKIGASCVRGNHEDRILLLTRVLSSSLLRYNGGVARDDPALEKSSNPLSKLPDESISAQLSPDQINYLESCPVILQVGHIDALHGNVVVVHAGLVPAVPLNEQDPSSVMTMRTIDLHSHVPSKHGKEGPGMDGNRNPPGRNNPTGKRLPMKKWPYNVHWARLWNQFQMMLPEFTKWKDKETMVVVYGHDSKRGLDLNKWSKGLDSGCVNGGRLTALVVGSGLKKEEIVSVKCKNYSS